MGSPTLEGAIGVDHLEGGLGPSRAGGLGTPTGEWFDEATTCAAGNRVSFATGTSEEHEAMLRAKDGRWLLWHWSEAGGSAPTCTELQPAPAREWLLRNDHFEAVSEAFGTPLPVVVGGSDRVAVEQSHVYVQRVYDPRTQDGGHRVLVDRLWPRGVRRDADLWDEWVRDIAPSSALRRWYGHLPDRFEEFQSRYQSELDLPAVRPFLDRLAESAASAPLVLVTATREVELSAARVLREVIENRLGGLR